MAFVVMAIVCPLVNFAPLASNGVPLTRVTVKGPAPLFVVVVAAPKGPIHDPICSRAAPASGDARLSRIVSACGELLRLTDVTKWFTPAIITSCPGRIAEKSSPLCHVTVLPLPFTTDCSPVGAVGPPSAVPSNHNFSNVTPPEVTLKQYPELPDPTP